jgi:hypothetical protein
MSAQDGVGVPEGGAGSTTTSESQGGASGSDNGAWSLGTGGIVGISVGIAVVVIGIGEEFLEDPTQSKSYANTRCSWHVVALVHGKEAAVEDTRVNQACFATPNWPEGPPTNPSRSPGECKVSSEDHDVRQAFRRLKSADQGSGPRKGSRSKTFAEAVTRLAG